MKIKVQTEPGLPGITELELVVVENHPEASVAGVCRICEPKDEQPVAAVGYPPFHPNCVCTVEWREG